MFVEGPQPVPTAGLDQSFAPVNVEPLVAVPPVGTARASMSLWRGEEMLRREDVRPDVDGDWAPVRIVVRERLGRKPPRVRLVAGEWIPSVDGAAIGREPESRTV